MNIKRTILMTLFFLLAIGIAVGAGVFRDINDEERGSFTFQIPEEKKQIIIIDLAKQGLLKYYLQPGTLTIYGRGKNILQDRDSFPKAAKKISGQN